MYLPDDLLVKVDVATMAHSLEARSPFLDHHVMEYAARLPDSLKLRDGQTKYILKKSLRGILPAQVLERPKMGFGVPVGRWFREDLKEMVHEVLLGERALARGYFRRGSLVDIVSRHMSGREDRGNQLWNLLMFELWHRMFIDRPGWKDPPAGT
jgi:asparagine synthase (glutamine-hydrolysing)